MNQELYFEQIHPFIRYARLLELNNDTFFPTYIPYDCRLFYTYKGHGSIRIAETTYEMPKGSLVLFQSCVQYKLISPGTDSVTYIALNFDFTYNHFKKNYPIPPDKPENFNKKELLETVNFIDLPAFNSPVVLCNMEPIENELLEIEYEFRQNKLYCNNKISSILQSVLFKIARHTNLKSSNGKKGNDYIDKIIRYIQNHYNEKMSNKDIGEMFNFHPNYINYLMKSHTGHSLHNYIITLRVSKAIYLLETTNLSIKEICETVGFKDICHFSRYFKKVTGRNPCNFRRSLI